MELANNPFIVRVNPNGLSIFFLEDADSPYDLGSYFAELNDRPQEKAALIAILRDIAACGIEENGAVVSVRDRIYLARSPNGDCLGLLETDDDQFVICSGGRSEEDEGFVKYLLSVQRWHREKAEVDDDE